jgi:hypothetical protein
MIISPIVTLLMIALWFAIAANQVLEMSIADNRYITDDEDVTVASTKPSLTIVKGDLK